MADDGILMNFSIGDGPLVPKQHFQGGRWRDRLAAKKVAKSRTTKRTNPNPSSRDLFQEKRHDVAQEDYIGPNPKRQRIEQKEGNANRTPVGVRERAPEKVPERAERAERAPPKTRAILENDETRAKYISGKLPPGSIGGGGLGAKKKFGDEEVENVRPAPTKTRTIIENDETRPQYISGKLPPGSIGGGALGAKKKFGDEEFGNDTPTVREETRPAFVSGKLPSGSIKIGNGGNSGHKTSFIPGKQNPGNTGPGVDSKGKPGQIISSLFSFNPSSKTTFEEPEEEVEPAKPSNAPLTEEMETFTALGLSRRLAAHLSTKMDMKAPTAIQKAAIPEMIKEDSDAFIQAETGSGKTLAYLLPIVERILALSEAGAQVHRDSGLFAVVLAPTRELCKQIATVLEKILRCAPWIVGTTVIGGESKNSEKARLRKGVNILIATPGRLADHLDNTEVLNVSTVRWLVLDEGDRLIELGFEEEIRGIVEKIGRRALTSNHKTGLDLKALPSRRITVLCSATMKMNVQRLGEISLKDAVHIQADPTEEEKANKVDGDEQKKFSAPAQLKQAYAVVPAKLRLVTLTAILKRAFARRGSVMKAIVFISCADSVDFHFSLFSRTLEAAEGEETVETPTINKTELTKDTIAHATAFSSKDNSVVLAKLHGSLAQNIRTATLKAFTESTEPCVLICTDVASRGLDLPNVDYVIEYDPPFSADDHLHRVGRTARAGKDGRALIFLMPGEEEEYVSILASGYREGKKALVHNTADDLLRKGFGGTGKEWEDRATEYQLEVERWTQESPKYLEMARRGFQSHIRAYATHVANERHIFNMQTLHLGHLAKAFALRDKPGSIKVPGLRPQKMTKADRSVAARKAKRGEVEEKVEGERERKLKKIERDAPVVDGGDAVRRMKKKMKEHMAVASEFNIG